MSITFGNKVNRSFSMYVPFNGDNVSFKVFFHKTNTYLGFTTDHSLSNMVRNGEAATHIYRDLNQSSFASTFLDIRNFSSPNLDIRCQFSNVLEQYREKIQYLSNETIKLAKYSNPKNPKKTFESLLYIYAFGFSDYPDDFLYILAERQHIDLFLNKKLVRTSALQISTKSFNDDLQTIVKNCNGHSDSELRNEFTPVDIDQDLEDLFGSKDTNVRKM